MDLVVPGSAQVVSGNKKLGRIAYFTWAVCLVLLVLTGLTALVNRAFVISIFTNPIVLVVLSVLVPLIFVGWGLLILDAWRLGMPTRLARKNKGANLAPVMSRTGAAISGALSLLLAFVMFTAAWFSFSILSSASSMIGTIFTGGGNAQTNAGRYNILLLGGDAGADREGLRPDTVMVASIDANTGKTVLFSLPRNLQHVPFPESSPLYKLYPPPENYWCYDSRPTDPCMLNSIYTEAENHKDLFKGVKWPGVEATKGAVEETLGLKINYWAMIDMRGFEKLIDALGGIRLDVGRRIPIGSHTGKKGVYGYIEPGKDQLLNGFQALWFARSREGSSDYDRMQRQQCVINAMVKQLDPGTVLTNFQAIADASSKVVATDLPADQISTMLELALQVKKHKLKSVSFVPPLIETYAPDLELIRQTVKDEIAKSEATAKPKASQSASSQPAEQQPAEQPSAEQQPAEAQPAAPASEAQPAEASPSASKDDSKTLDSVCSVS
jgi:LCP family protein required for cell wall assembly